MADPAPNVTSFERQRQRMVDTQLVARGIRDEATLAAMRTVPRERFVPAQVVRLAYRDSPLPIEDGQTISQPFIVALMTEALELSPQDRVLEVGAGSGYAAAVLSRVAAEVYTIERHPRLANLARQRAEELGYDNISVLCGDGSRGWPDHAPFDAIVVTASDAAVPSSLLEQLKIGGRLVMPVGLRPGSQDLLRLRRISEHQYEKESLGAVQFVPLIRDRSNQTV